MNNWRRQLEEIGAYDNRLMGIPASAAVEMVRDIDALQAALNLLVRRARPFTSCDIVDETGDTIPLMVKLGNAIKLAEPLGETEI